jgi:hypothetical protein
MTDLRDARLAQALQHAPDSDAQPRAATRDAIKNIAARAVHPGARASNHHQPSWWERCWHSMAQTRGPWGGALATVVLGCIITLMWYEQELPTPALPPTAPDRAPEVPAPAAAPAPTSTSTSTSTSEADLTPQRALAPLSTLGKAAAPPPEAAREAAASPAMPRAEAEHLQAQGAVQDKALSPSPVLPEQGPAQGQTQTKIASAATAPSPVTTAEASTDTASDRAVPIASAAPAAPLAEASPRARQSGASSVLRGLTASETTPSASAMLPASLLYRGRSYALSPTQIAQWQQLLAQSTANAVVDAPGHSVATTSAAQVELRLVLPSQAGGPGDGGDVLELSGLRFVWKRAGQAPVTGSLRAQDRAALLRTAQEFSAQP